MSKLVCVEYNPVLNDKRSKVKMEPLIGCIGETFEHYLSRARRDGDIKIPVRFPLAAPGSRAVVHRTGVQSNDPIFFREQSVDLPVYSLFPMIRRVPISNYTRFPLDEMDGIVDKVFEKASYLSTFNRDKFVEALGIVRKIMGHMWEWKKESHITADQLPPTFIEGRFYGIDNIISTYDRRAFRGLAIEIIFRPQPSLAQREGGIRRVRCASDVVLASNKPEYVNYIDGVNISRETAKGEMLDIYAGFLTAKQTMDLSKSKESLEELLKKRKKEKQDKLVNAYFPSSSTLSFTTTSTTTNW